MLHGIILYGCHHAVGGVFVRVKSMRVTVPLMRRSIAACCFFIFYMKRFRNLAHLLYINAVRFSGILFPINADNHILPGKHYHRSRGVIVNHKTTGLVFAVTGTEAVINHSKF
jgi:hypothetical protein